MEGNRSAAIDSLYDAIGEFAVYWFELNDPVLQAMLE
jgi:hypothetical protein